ncbi:MAG: UDP-N-acetylmuramate dehydrogenase [Thermoleophilia bacterium]
MRLDIRRDVPLAPLTTLELGGPARFFLEAPDEQTLAAGIRWAREQAKPVFLLGGGSNLVVADGGFAGLVIRPTYAGIQWGPDDPTGTMVEVGSGHVWDELVAAATSRDLAGLECLSGIPGTVGAAPVQNVGAYGQEAADTIVSVRGLDLSTLQVVHLPADGCAFGYRDSLFRRAPGLYAVLSVTFGLRAGGAPTLLYPELISAIGDRPAGLREVRDTVLTMRRRKSMLLDPDDENRRSVGSFFTNPIVTREEAARVAARRGGADVQAESALPSFPMEDGRVKLSAAWLIERSGFSRGFRRGRVGISTRHTLALVNMGGATSCELLALAAEVRAGVLERFGVSLGMEPVCLGCTPPW